MIQSICMHEVDSHEKFNIANLFPARKTVVPVASEMGLINFTIVSAKFLNILSWPPLPLLYPLFFSIWAIESDRERSYEQCLKYWILFCITSICESMIALLLPWLPFWPYVRGTAFLLLAVPDFGGASYVYKNFIRPYTKLNSDVAGTLLIPEGRCNMLIEEEESFYENEQGRTSERMASYEGDFSSSMLTIQSPVTWSERPNRNQRDWSCAICLVSTDSQKCLMQHLRGKKHQLKEEELRYVEVMASETVVNSTQTIKSNNMVLVESLSQITRANFQRLSGLITPSTRPYKQCVWTKPECGWMKLNTDGSIDKRNAGFGGLLRDFMGEPICAYVSKTSTNDIFLAELWAIWRGLVLASSLGLKLIWVESDSMSVVKTINKEQPYGPKAGNYLKDIWKLLRKFDKYKVSHSFRESNKAADYLSRMHLLGCDVVLWPVDFPVSLWDIIKDDARGKQYFRA